MSYRYDLAIAYRIYPKISKVPPIHPDNKLLLSELCLASITKSLRKIKRVKWFVILDDCPAEYSEMFKKYLPDDAEYINTDVRSNGKTFGMQLNILLNQKYSEKIYFAEDDYFYLPSCFEKMLGAIDKPGFDFISPYDHLDLYTHELHNSKYQIKFNDSAHWRTCGSTTMTFLTTKKTMKKTERVFRTYVRGNYDSSLWMTLTRENVNNPFRFVKLARIGKEAILIFAKAWIYSMFDVIFGKKYNLFTPIPSLAQHLDKNFMAPAINWNNKFEEGEKWLIK